MQRQIPATGLQSVESVWSVNPIALSRVIHACITLPRFVFDGPRPDTCLDPAQSRSVRRPRPATLPIRPHLFDGPLFTELSRPACRDVRRVDVSKRGLAARNAEDEKGEGTPSSPFVTCQPPFLLSPSFAPFGKQPRLPCLCGLKGVQSGKRLRPPGGPGQERRFGRFGELGTAGWENGLRTLTPVRATSPTLRVTNVSWWLKAVAARRPSTGAIG